MIAHHSPEFQTEILKYLVQKPEGKLYIPMLDTNLFDLSEYMVTFELLNKYLQQYGQVPKYVNMIEYFNDAIKNPKNKVTVEQKQIIETAIGNIYQNFEAEIGQVKEKIVEFAQYKKTKRLFTEYAPRLNEGLEVFKKIRSEMQQIVQVGDTNFLEDWSRKNKFLLTDTREMYRPVEPIQFFLKGMNRLTAANGFYPPQLIVLMGGPKAFKTGLLINIGVELMRDGYNVLYGDTENGVRNIKARIRQCMLKCTPQELRSGEYNEVLEEMSMRFKAMGGELVVNHYPAYTSTMADVDADLTDLRDNQNWRPDVILLDYADLFRPIDRTIKERRLMLQAVYFDIINLNNKWDTLSVTPTPVNKKAVEKAIIKIGDFAEDFGKAYNCHSAWALCRTQEEKVQHTARLIPVAQRDGVSFVEGVMPVPQVLLEINEEKMQVEEINFAEAVKRKSNVKSSELVDN